VSIDVLVIAGAGVDITVRVDAHPVPYADSVAVPPIREHIGHPGNGVSLGCHALGLRVKFVDFIGDDPQGALIRDHLRDRGVDFSWLISPAGTTRSVNLVDRHGRRMSFFDARDVPGRRMPAEFVAPYLPAARHVHVSITDYARHFYPEIHRLGIPVSTDLHDWDGVNDHHRDFAYGSDIVFLSTVALGDRVEEVMRHILDRGRAQVVVATAGEHGGYVRTADEAWSFRAAPCGAVDSNGAGDAFVSGFLYGRLTGRPLAECVRFGAVAGAYACGTAGTHQSLITPEALHRQVA
jgi:sugar/nucleoside kinase (ribokinase family)